jgi:hypothetical protein
MMKNLKKGTLFFLALLIVYSCKLTDEKKANDIVTETSNKVVKDSTLVNDKDENGCLTSAGYVWSKVNKECVKVYTGIQLNPIDKSDNEDESMSAYILFNENASKAEVFLPNETSSIVLIREKEGKPWVSQDWQLISWKGYILKKGNTNLFSGDAEIGKKVMGSNSE